MDATRPGFDAGAPLEPEALPLSVRPSLRWSGPSCHPFPPPRPACPASLGSRSWSRHLVVSSDSHGPFSGDALASQPACLPYLLHPSIHHPAAAAAPPPPGAPPFKRPILLPLLSSLASYNPYLALHALPAACQPNSPPPRAILSHHCRSHRHASFESETKRHAVGARRRP